MVLKVEQLYSNGWRGIGKGIQYLKMPDLRSVAIENYLKTVDALSIDPDINISVLCGDEVFWGDDVMTETDPPFEQYRVSFLISKKGRTKLTEKDIHDIINNIVDSNISKI